MVSGGRLKAEVDMAVGESRPFLAGGSSGESETEFTTDAEDMSLTEKKAPSSGAANPKSALDLIGDNSGDLPDRPDGASYVGLLFFVTDIYLSFTKLTF